MQFYCNFSRTIYAMSFTVVPLHNLAIPAGSSVPFGSKFVLQDLPQWLARNSLCLDDISGHDRRSVLRTKHALVSEYEAASIGHPDPEWKGHRLRGVQDLRFQSAILANMSMWFIQPSMVCFTVAFHALQDGQDQNIPLTCWPQYEGPVYCHPLDQGNSVELRHLQKSATLFETLSLVPHKTSVWAALRAFWAALVSYSGDNRYPLFWQGLESLFGAEDGKRDISRRLRDRISFFLADNLAEQQNLCDMVKRCYKTRSEIVHGRWEEGPEINDRMRETENIVRTVVRQVADRPGMLDLFLSPKRDGFLETRVQSKAFVAPPFP